MNHFLLEIGLEEVPAQMILPAGEQLRRFAQQWLEKESLSGSIEVFGTPRRLAILISEMPAKQESRTLEIKGPPAQIARDAAGNWTPAALGFAKKNQITAENLEIRQVDGKDYLFVAKVHAGRPTPELLAEQVADWIFGLRFPKNMRWGSYKLRFVRPIRWLTCLWNQEVLPVRLEVISSGRETRGHRFLHPEPINLSAAKDYEQTLESLQVQASFTKRKLRIEKQINALEQKYGFKVSVSAELLEEVTNLLEWPTALVGHFEPEFLELPSEVLVTSMAVHQRYFPVYSSSGALLSHFVTIRNGDSHALDTVQQGNERVIRARLSDARFFYREDQKASLQDFQQKASQAVFFPNRGNQLQRVERIQQISAKLAQSLSLSSGDQAASAKIAELCKFDLQTQLVYEFPELQGVMGERYAQLWGESAEVCLGIREHYYPRNAEDQCPQQPCVWPTALADKLDTLVVAFSLNMIPTGAADPFALRRMGQGILQILLSLQLPLSLEELVEVGIQSLQDQQANVGNAEILATQLLDFLRQRQRFLLQEQYGLRHDVLQSLEKGKLIPAVQRQYGETLMELLDNPQFKAAVEAVVRPFNLWQKNQNAELLAWDEDALELAAEKELKQASSALQVGKDPAEFVETLMHLEPVITAFFDQVMVMDNNPAKRSNRLHLCRTLHDWSAQAWDPRELIFSRS